MRKTMSLCFGALALSWTAAALAQTDALVVAESGNVGVGTSTPNQAIAVTVARRASFADVPRRCEQRIPVRIVIDDAITGSTLLLEQQFLTASSRVFSATLPPAGDAERTFQVGVLTRASLIPCIAIEVAVVGPDGIRRLVPDG